MEMLDFVEDLKQYFYSVVHVPKSKRAIMNYSNKLYFFESYITECLKNPFDDPEEILLHMRFDIYRSSSISSSSRQRRCYFDELQAANIIERYLIKCSKGGINI